MSRRASSRIPLCFVILRRRSSQVQVAHERAAEEHPREFREMRDLTLKVNKAVSRLGRVD